MGGIAGGDCCWEALLELIRGEAATGLGDAGTEFRSGAILNYWQLWIVGRDFEKVTMRKLL